MSLFDLTGRCIVVTGSRGMLGRPICAALVEAGATVISIDSAPKLGLVDSVWECVADVGDTDELVSILTTLYMHGGGEAPDGLLCLAGLDAKPGTNDADPWRDFGELLVANLAGTANACRVFGQSMAESGRGSIVTVGSLYSHLVPDQRLYFEEFTKPIGYAASKHGVLGLTRQLAAMWGDRGVRVNCLSPGGIRSDDTPGLFRHKFEQRVPLGRMGTPGDLVGAIIWLISSASEYVTGQEIRVDGGCGVIP